VSHDLAEKNATVPLDKSVWEQWLAKNRESERLLNARIVRIAIAAAVAMFIFAAMWLARPH
jgi:hypothetical protein